MFDTKDLIGLALVVGVLYLIGKGASAFGEGMGQAKKSLEEFVLGSTQPPSPRVGFTWVEPVDGDALKPLPFKWGSPR